MDWDINGTFVIVEAWERGVGIKIIYCTKVIQYTLYTRYVC
jgi:hypothetical protein